MPPRTKSAVTPAAAKTTGAKRSGDDALIAKIDHKDGCPDQRSEVYSTNRPEDQGGAPVRVARCIDCGQFTTKEARSGTEDEEGDD